MSQLSLDTILAAVKAGENADWELKSARGGFPGSFWETYSGMANTEGGTIVLGVTERPDRVRLDGLDAEQLARYQKILWDSLNDRGKVSANLLGAGDVEVVPVGDTHLMVVRVPRATRTQRPVYLGAGPLGHTYRRRHEGDYRCSDAEVRRMLSDADPEPADQRILTHFGREDLDPTSLRQYRQRLGAAKGDHP